MFKFQSNVTINVIITIGRLNEPIKRYQLNVGDSCLNKQNPASSWSSVNAFVLAVWGLNFGSVQSDIVIQLLASYFCHSKLALLLTKRVIYPLRKNN